MNTSLSITKTIHDWLYSVMPESVASITEMVLIATVYLAVFAVFGLYLVLLERRWDWLSAGTDSVKYLLNKY